MTVPATADSAEEQTIRRGQIIIVGAGIAAVSQLTLEALSYIKSADILFFHSTSAVMAAHITLLQPNSVDLYQLYGEKKTRRKTYIQMAEVMLNEARQGRRVVGVFHGHPGFFVMAARRVRAISEREAHTFRLVPGISSIDCLMADLSIDAGLYGLQILKAGSYLRGKAKLATSGHIAFLQVHSVGDSAYSFSGYKETKRAQFFEMLIEEYGDSQEIVYYVAPTLPGLSPVIKIRTLSEYRKSEVFDRIGAGIVYLPPKGMTYSSTIKKEALGNNRAYADLVADALRELVDVGIDPNYPSDRSSQAMLDAITELASDASRLALYRNEPELFLEGHPNLSPSERRILLRRPQFFESEGR